MPCYHYKMPDGSAGIFCTRGPVRKTEYCICGAPSKYLCDYPALHFNRLCYHSGVNPTRYSTDGSALPENWHMLPIRWVLNPDHPDHCEACLEYAGEYKSDGHMTRQVGGAQPGYFPGCIRLDQYYHITFDSDANKLRACGEKCECWLEVLVGGEWKRMLV